MKEEFYRGQRITIRTNSGKVIKGKFKSSIGSNQILLTDEQKFDKDKTEIKPSN